MFTEVKINHGPLIIQVLNNVRIQQEKIQMYTYDFVYKLQKSI